MNSNHASDSTLGYYAKHAEAFIARTHEVDMQHVRERFVSRLPSGASILDLGCGSGRDLVAFKAMGYSPRGLEPVHALAVHARNVSGCEVVEKTVQEAGFDSVFDGIWACASLLHVPRAELPTALTRIARWARGGGWLSASFKNGDRERHDEGRYFNDLTPDLARTMLSGIDEWKLVETWNDQDSRGRDLSWTNILAKRL